MHLKGKKKDLGVYLWKMLKSHWGMYISISICLLLLDFGDNSFYTGWGHCDLKIDVESGWCLCIFMYYSIINA